MSSYTKYYDSCLAVFQGGGCKAVAYIGAYEVACKHGVVFNEFAGASAGSIIAALFAANAKPKDVCDFVLSDEVQNMLTQYEVGDKTNCCYNLLSHILLKTKKAAPYLYKLKKSEFKTKYGLFSLETLEILLEKEIQKYVQNSGTKVRFKDLRYNLCIISADTETAMPKIWNKQQTPEESVVEAVCASCAIPGYFQPIKERYVDGGLLSNSPLFIFGNEPNYTKIVSFRLQSSIKNKNNTLINYGKSLLSTIVDGAVYLQNTMNIGNIGYSEITIDTGTISATDFKEIKTQQGVKGLIQKGETAAEDFFNKEYKFHLPENHPQILTSLDQVYSMVATYSTTDRFKEIVISTSDTSWYHILFPTLLKWLDNRPKLMVYTYDLHNHQYDTETRNQERMRRLRLVYSCGCHLNASKQLHVKGFFLKTEQDQWKGVVYTESNIGQFEHGLYYDNIAESFVIENALKLAGYKESDLQPCLGFSMQTIEENRIFDKLQEILDFRNCSMHFEEIDVGKIFFKHDLVDLVKYRQVDKFFNLNSTNILPFGPQAIEFYKDHKQQVLCPIIVECQGDKYIIIKGETRVKYAFHHGYRKIRVLVTSGYLGAITPKCSVDQLIIAVSTHGAFDLDEIDKAFFPVNYNEYTQEEINAIK